MDAKDYASANNRAYYAIFHAMGAVLALDEEDYKKHSAVIARFPLDHIAGHRRARNQRFRARFLRASSGFIPRLLFAFCPVAQLCCGAVWAAIRA
ncbi:MAG: HEPN domain-containing protein [Oscillospiraceae bacterium]|nr:HEPN domain-containing protein [Oscillospiraceae bacterium]